MIYHNEGDLTFLENETVGEFLKDKDSNIYNVHVKIIAGEGEEHILSVPAAINKFADRKILMGKVIDEDNDTTWTLYLID